MIASLPMSLRGIRAAAFALALCGILTCAPAFAEDSADGVWSDVTEPGIPRSGLSSRVLPLAYRTVALDGDALNSLLAQTPLESVVPAGRSAVRLSLPLPGGGYGEFQIVEAPIMEPELAAKFPQIRTFLGQGIDDRTATLRFDVTPQGFHAQIISWEGTSYIDPYQPGDTTHYIAYRKRDAQASGPRPVCQVTGQELPVDAPNFQKRGVAAKVASGSSLRTYRAAVAATGEYTAFHGGTVALGLAAIVTTMNRVNGIYERDLSVRMVLVANNNLLVYTNGGTDPYTNNDGIAMLDENQANITNVIGAANYDIGHVVSTGGGGIAALAAVCNNSSKAQGVTGSPSPVGDAFDVDYVAHEIGHQFGANHTFNATTGACGGNRNASTAYEVGSGITIMSYAGICNPNNVQLNSSDYFHRGSLNEMLAFTTSPGGGASCGTATATGNTPPSVSTTASYTIPTFTPFALTAVGSDSNGDALTYLWEEFDLGPAVNGGATDNGSSPILRNYNPTSSPTRTFPELASILSGANGNAWERLPTTNRTVNFRVTARDNRAGGGGTNEAAVVLTSVNTGAAFRVTSPNSAVTWSAAVAQTITWDVAGTVGNGINTANVRISLSLDGGNTFPLILANSTPNDGSATLVLAGATATTQARIKIEAVGNIFFDISNSNFTITTAASPGITVNPASGLVTTEGAGTASFDVVLNNPPTADVSFGLISSNTAEGLVSPSSLTFTPANWNVPQAVTVTGVDDAVVDGSVGYAILTTPATSADANYNGLNPADVSVSNSDNDSAVVSFAAAGISQSEVTPLMFFSVTLSNPVESGVTLSVNSANGTATAADYTPISATVSFPPGSTLPQVVMVTIANDTLDEVDENFTLTLSGLTATGDVTLGTSVATGTILDDDATPTLSITSPSLNEGNGGPSTMNFVVSLSAVSGRNVSFTGATTDGSATIADNDYVALASTPFTIPAGQTSVTIPVTINGDTAFEGNETFSVNLTGITNATPGTLTGTGTILEDDQQSTTTTITADLPDPSVVGQAYPVNVTVASQTLSPTGTVTISDGTASCGPVTLTAGTAPNSTASCSLTSTTAGAKTLTASYTAATTAFGNSSGTTAHQVNPAGTSISVTGPTRSRINQPSSFSFALSVNSPGAGTPTGTVTLSSGASSCTATLPATSCNLSFNTLGTRTVSASYAGDGNFSASSSSGAGNAPTLVYALADLSVTKNDGVTTYEPGDLLVYSVIVRNLGPDAAANIRITDIIPTGLSSVVWSCDASGGGVCPVSGGAGNLDVTIASFPVGGLLNFTFYGNVAGSPASISNTASLTLPADTTIEDPVLGNNSATDSDLLEFLFRNGFEDPLVNAPTGSLRIPALALVRTLADEASIVLRLTDARGEAVRVYARLHEATIQYAVAGRGANGLLRLGAWTALPGEPTLSWTARQVADGWVVETVELR